MKKGENSQENSDKGSVNISRSRAKTKATIHPLFQNSGYPWGFRISCPFGLHQCVLFTYIQE